MSAAFFLPNTKAGDGPPGILADAIDFATGEYLSIERSYDPTDAALFTAVRTVRGSGSAVEDVGQRYHEHPLVDDGLEMFLRQETEFAVRHLTESKQIKALSVAIATADDYGEVAYKYENIAQQRERTALARMNEIAP